MVTAPNAMKRSTVPSCYLIQALRKWFKTSTEGSFQEQSLCFLIFIRAVQIYLQMEHHMVIIFSLDMPFIHDKAHAFRS